MTRIVFADTCFWIALLAPNDQWHQEAQRASESLIAVRILTTEEVLCEMLNAFSRLPGLRRAAIHQVDLLLASPSVEIIPQTSASFGAGLALYRERLDKTWSLTDCISMSTMWDRGIDEVLSHDRHFAQAGFRLLMAP